MSIVRTLVTIIYQFLYPAKYEEEPFTFWPFTWYPALVWLVSSVNSDVSLEVGQLGEGLGAAWNNKRGVRKGSGRVELREKEREKVLLSQFFKFDWW